MIFIPSQITYTMFLNHFLLLFYYNCPNFSPFALLQLSHPWSHTQFLQFLCPWVIYTCSLSSLFPFFPPLCFPLPSGHFQFVPCFQACGSILLISLFLFITFLLWVRSYGICLLPTGLFHLA